MARNKELDAIRRELHGRSGFRGSVLLFLIVSFMGVAGYWATVTEIDDVTRASGRVVPSSETQVIQTSEPGVLSELLVAKGDTVQPGQVLMAFDRTQLQSQLSEAQQRTFALRLRILRLEAEVGAKQFTPPRDLTKAAPSVFISENALFEAHHRAFEADVSVLSRQSEQSQTALEDALAQKTTATEMLALVDQERQIMTPLVAQHIEPETTLLSLSQKQTELQGRVDRARSAAAQARAKLAEIDDKRRALDERRKAKAQTELASSVADLEALRPRVDALSQRVRRTELRSPVRGIVNQILLTTIGGVAQPGQSLMEIVPIDDGLLIEAYVPPTDIAFLYAGQSVKVKITAYDFSRYGGLDGKIVRIGANAVTNPGTKAKAFVVEVRTQSNILDANGAALEIIPGMTAQIDILSKKKTVLDYIIRPVIRVKQRAFRD